MWSSRIYKKTNLIKMRAQLAIASGRSSSKYLARARARERKSLRRDGPCIVRAPSNRKRSQGPEKETEGSREKTYVSRDWKIDGEKV